VKLGLEEGVELHVVGMGLGVHTWPPALSVPVNPGRVGFGDGAHLPASHTEDPYRHDFAPLSKREVGLGDAWMFARLARVGDPARAGGLEDRATVGLSARALYGPRVGYAFGADLEVGAAAPAAFAYDLALYPLGIGLGVGPTGVFSVLGGFGASGVTGAVPGGLELPAEARFEIDVTRHARLGARGGVVWLPWVDARHAGSKLAPFADELVLGIFARFGVTRPRREGALGHGYFFGLERRELMRTFWLGLTVGVEMDGGG
jgi:hypothetical protein